MPPQSSCCCWSFSVDNDDAGADHNGIDIDDDDIEAAAAADDIDAVDDCDDANVIDAVDADAVEVEDADIHDAVDDDNDNVIDAAYDDADVIDADDDAELVGSIIIRRSGHRGASGGQLADWRAFQKNFLFLSSSSSSSSSSLSSSHSSSSKSLLYQDKGDPVEVDLITKKRGTSTGKKYIISQSWEISGCNQGKNAQF